MDDDLLTAPQFAEESGVEKRYLTRWAKRGEVEGARQVGGGPKRKGTWEATRGAWRAAVAKERKAGRPPNKKGPGSS